MQYIQKYSRSKLKLKISYQIKLLKSENFKFDLNICILKKNIKFNPNELLPCAGQTRMWHQHGSYTPTFFRAILCTKSSKWDKHFCYVAV